MGKRLGPEAKIIALFIDLPEENKRIVLDVLKSQTAAKKTVRKKKPTLVPDQEKDQNRAAS